jgi:hypothetical protein
VSHRSSSSNKRNGLMSGLWWRESVRFCRLIPPRAPGTLALPPEPGADREEKKSDRSRGIGGPTATPWG